MEILKFNLSGRTAFFKKPDVNTYTYFTYGQIHKVALLGILGSCLGLNGYMQQSKEELYPEFYKELKSLKVAIVPKSENGFIPKKIQTFNNSTMFANEGSDRSGANLIVKEQWLENPSWDIYILLDGSDVCNLIKQKFLSRTFTYIPYLGKNDHIADIYNIEIISDIKKVSNVSKVNSLLRRDDFEFVVDEYDNFNTSFKYQEKLPYELEELTNQYILDTFVYTNISIEPKKGLDIFKVKYLNLCFI